MFETVNHLEAGLWIVIGLIFAVAGIRPSGRALANFCFFSKYDLTAT